MEGNEFLNEVSSAEIKKVIIVGLILNPIAWLELLGSSVVQLIKSPAKILMIIRATFLCTTALFRNPNFGILSSLIVSFAVYGRVLFWTIPIQILFPLLRLALLCILIDLRCEHFIVDSATGNILDRNDLYSDGEGFLKSTVSTLESMDVKNVEDVTDDKSFKA